jgi:hypothetical protein
MAASHSQLRSTLVFHVAVRRGRCHTPHHWCGLFFYFGLLVNCRKHGLLGGVTSLSVPAQAASALVPSVKTVTGSTPIDSMLAEFPDLTRPAGVQREVRHNTVHYIRTIPGPPVTCLPRRLANGSARYRKSRFQRHVARRHSSPLRDFLVFGVPHRTQEGKQVVSLWRLQSPKLPYKFPTATPSGISITPTSFSVVPSPQKSTW